MTNTDALHQRGKALEDEFFHRVDEKLMLQLEKSLQRDEERARLSAATGFQNEALLDHLIDAGFGPKRMAALALVPMVFVAWADGTVTPQERQAVISAAIHRGLKDDPGSYSMLDGWLHHRPGPELWQLWTEYIEALKDSLSPTLAEMLRSEILRLATSVATATDGHHGKRKIAIEEQAILDKIAGVGT